MKHIFKNILLVILSILLVFSGSISAFAASSSKDTPVYTSLRDIDLGTFNEYRYRITEKFFSLKEHFEIHETMNLPILKDIGLLADTGYNYLPDNLENKNYLNSLRIELQKGVKDPDNEIIYVSIIKAIAAFLENVDITSVTGTVEATPKSGNAPLNVTLRGKVKDPSGTQIRSGNYTWWIDDAGKKVVIGRGPSINYTFRNEGTFSVFLDVTSSHKNKAGYTDVLPFSERIDINVNEKIASLIIKVNSDRVQGTELKFTPEDANYGLIFDATSSTPTSGAKFVRTEWDFGNGIRKGHNGGPKIERVRYAREGDYDVTLKLYTNEGKVVERLFTIYVHNPIARIEVNREDGYIGDKFTFAAKTSGLYRNLTYNWEIIDIESDRVVYQKSDKILTYTFTDKGKYNVKLKVRRSSGEVDQDTRIVYVTSQAPIAEYETEISQSNKPNRVYLDGSRSYDPDFSDDGNLKYDWYIDGNKVTLEDAASNGSTGYYTFDNIGTHSVNLEVTDPDGITAVKKGTVDVESILAVEMFAFPRVIKRDSFIKFVAQSPEASVYEWDFGDGQQTGGSFDKVTHTYNTSGKFDVTLTVSDKENNTNTFTRTIYVSESDKPLAFLDLNLGGFEKPAFDADACNGQGAYVVDRVSNITFQGDESIDIDGQATNLEYSWKIGHGKFSSTSTVSHKFDELGCFPVKLSVKSLSNGKTDAREIMMDVRNVMPTLTALGVSVENPDEDPLIVTVTAQGAKDSDGVIQSYLWYYYTDVDSNPQDFRATMGPSTSFVIPKITGNYYFVAILKDNNEARITSEEITGSRYFTTVTGDNINTPIVELSVNDNSSVIGEELTFTAKAQNILGQSIEKDASFSWDFDGDGFYDTQTSEPEVSYKYRKSGEFYAKVKVKYKGISSTKNITVNVSNKLVPDFDYISIGNKYIFFDSSNGQIDSREWDLGDGTKKSGTYFEHTYTDKASSHTVKLKITEGTKVKEVEKVVTKNVKNILKTKGRDLVVFTSPRTGTGGEIVLDAASERVFVYLGESSQDAVAYGIDYDIDHDSDLNGGSDDDEDNKGTASYVSGDVAEIPLSQYMHQKVRVFIKDADGNVIASEDIKIEKTYVEETEIDPSTIIFEGVTDSEKEKIEALKSELVKLPQQQRIKALSYVQKLQENWNDNTEKTRTILDFENYIFELSLPNEDELISILESLLVEGQEDQSARNITYQALVNLIPADVSCETQGATCYESLLSKLDDIKNSDDIEYNKGLGKEILEVVKVTDLMTTNQKLDFKAILTSLVYGGDVNAIPDDEKNQIIDESPALPDDTISEGGIMGILMLILKIIGYFLLVFVVIVGVFFMIYKILNKDKNITFAQYVSKTTSFGKDTNSVVDVSDQDDILSEFGDELSDVDAKEDPLFSSPKEEKKQEDKKTEAKTFEAPKTSEASNDEVPDWLKGNFSDDAPKKQEVKSEEKIPQPKIPEPKTEKTKPEPKKVEEKKENIKTPKTPEKSTDESVPDWLKGSFEETPKTKEKAESKAGEEKKEAKVKTEDKGSDNAKAEAGQKKETKKEDSFDLEKDTKISDENVPDWLKGSLGSTDDSKKEDTADKKTEVKSTPKKQETPKKTEKVEKAETKPVEKTTKTDVGDSSNGDVSVPDWLKGSFDEAPKTQTAPSEKSTTEKQEKTQVKDKSKAKAAPKKVAETKKTPEKKTDTKAAPTEKKDEKKKDELWDDGMKVPDWLKSDDDK